MKTIRLTPEETEFLFDELRTMIEDYGRTAADPSEPMDDQTECLRLSQLALTIRQKLL